MKNIDRSAGRLQKLGVALAIGLSVSLALSACAADDPLAQQAAVGDNKNYIAGDGSVTEYAAAERGEPLAITGTSYDGPVVDSADWVGQVTVVNFWYAACAPCREEAPDLVALHEEYESAGAQFFGVNIRDSQETAEAFERTFDIPYPSLNDQDGGVLLAMTTYVPPQAVPTTLVIDKEGRVSARILGLADKSTLGALIEAALAE
ncbi:TlpA family protein disulfide reductase [Arthrobacter sp. HLT1-21]